MDSGNSGSMQSDDQDFEDSRASESISHHFGSNISTFLAHDQNPTSFDPQLSHDNDLVWSRGLRSEEPNTNHFNFGNLSHSSSSLPSRTAHGPPITATTSPPSSSSLSSQLSNVIKNPKKRTRASRRAPTTVLTTDTTNFRQMVQEFTGIPGGPFPVFRSGPGHMDALCPLYPLRPDTAHKVNISPFPSSTSNNPNIISNFPVSSDDHLLNLQRNSINITPPQPSSLGKGSDSQLHHMSGYNLNHVEKGMENVASSGSQPTGGPWIYPSDHLT